MSKDDDEEWLGKLFDTRRAEKVTRLAEAKKAAATQAKEPFDFDRFDQFMRPPSYGTREQQMATYEFDYYVHHPEVKTLEAFAALLMRLDVDKDT